MHKVFYTKDFPPEGREKNGDFPMIFFVGIFKPKIKTLGHTKGRGWLHYQMYLNFTMNSTPYGKNIEINPENYGYFFKISWEGFFL